MVIGADLNGHVGEGKRGDENVMGRYGDKARNADGGGFRDKNGNGCGEHVFQKEGGAQGDVEEEIVKEIGDCKEIVGENVAKQHRLLVCMQDDFGDQEAEYSKGRAKDKMVEIEEGRLL